MNIATNCHLVRGEGQNLEILLGERSSLFHNGIWNGIGGKIENGECLQGCLIREVREEIGVRIHQKSVRYYGLIDCYSKHEDENEYAWVWRVHCYTASSWKGEPQTSNSISALKWYGVEHLPYEKMEVDQRIWLYPALTNTSGKIVHAQVHYGDVDCRIINKAALEFVYPDSIRLER